MKEELLIQYFYEGLLPIERQMLDASAGGALVDKTPVAAKTLIANRALNAQQYEGVGQRETPRQQYVNEVSSTSDIQSQLANLTSIVSQMAEGMRMQGPSICGVCSIQGHQSEKCPQLIENGGWESVNAIGYQGPNQPKYDPYANTYNPGWRDHPNFKWREPQQQGGFRPPPEMFPQPAQNNSGTSLDNATLLQILTKLSQGQEDQSKAMQDQSKAIQNQERKMNHLEKQIGQIAEFMGQFQEQGKLPSTTIVNPRGGFESAKAITLRSGKEVGTEPQPSKSAKQVDETLQNKEKNPCTPTARIEKSLPCPPSLPKPSNQGKCGPNNVNSNFIPPDVPFPSRFMQARNEEEEKDVLETFRKVHVNIPLLDAIKQIPKYAKFLKKLCTTRKRIKEKEVVHVSENVSAMLQRKLPPKCKDPGSFTIPCVIGNTSFEHAMLDLGASINVMPYSVYASMNLGELKNDGVIIQLADRSNAYPKGVLEDVLVQVDHLIFPADFYVIDMKDSAHSPPSPLLLGRPFMKTAHTKIDVAKGALTMEFGGDTINFKVSEPIENTNAVRSCCAIDVITCPGKERIEPMKMDRFRTTKEGIGVKCKGHIPTIKKPPNLAEPNTCAFVHKAATSLQRNGKSHIPKPIHNSTNRLLHSFVQVPKQMKGDRSIHVGLRKSNAKIRKDHYPRPFKDSISYVVEDMKLYDVGPIQD